VSRLSIMKVAGIYLWIFRMNVAAGPKLAAAVTNAGGLGVIGGVGYTPKVLRQQVSVF
jgi:NAD(P)H-dependent flavin oxidoreductase YrpB (nitropropane dioxygenase family)